MSDPIRPDDEAAERAACPCCSASADAAALGAAPVDGGIGRRDFIKRVGVAGAGVALAAMPHLWLPNPAIAQTDGRGTIKHLIYVRLSGGFRFTAAFNADVAAEYNPFGAAERVAEGAEWGVGELLTRAPWLEGEGGAALREQGVLPVHEIADQIAVLPCVDHEPLSGSADGNHGTGLERFLTGYVGGHTSFFTMINYGLRERVEAASVEGQIILPAFVLGGSGMALGGGAYAAHRPPVMQDGGFDRFGFSAEGSLARWALEMSDNHDRRMRDRQHAALRDRVDGYLRTRLATESYNEIFQSDLLKIRDRSDEVVDGVSNTQLAALFGDSRAARNLRLGLRLFHFGCPAIYLDQGGYDMHSGEQDGLPGRIDELNRLISALHVSLKAMTHPDGGSYWDHTVVAFGSEFGRTARGNRFNSARGSDHGGDLATRWMSMPFMGGPVSAIAGRRVGSTRGADLVAEGEVFSYRGVLKTLLDGLAADHQEFFPADDPFNDLFV